MTKKTQHVLSEDQLASLVNPRTREVYSAFQQHGTQSVAQLQALLGSHSKTIYYQVKKLVDTGLLRVKDKGRGRAHPATYEAIAQTSKIPDGFQGERYEYLAAELAAATLRKTIRRVKAAAEASKEDPSLVDAMHMSEVSLCLKPADVKKLSRRFTALLQEFQSLQTEGTNRRVEVVVSIAPVDDSN